jgi:hypothetical protein
VFLFTRNGQRRVEPASASFGLTAETLLGAKPLLRDPDHKLKAALAIDAVSWREMTEFWQALTG